MPAMPFARFTTTVNNAYGDIDTMQFKTRLVAQVPRIHCKEHGIKSLKVLMADTQARFTHLFDSLLMFYRLVATRHAAKLLGLSWDEVHHIQSRAVKRGMDRRSVETVQETQYRRSCESRNPVKQPNPQGFSTSDAT